MPETALVQYMKDKEREELAEQALREPPTVLKRVFGAEQAPQPLIGVVDSGADTSHVLLKRVKEVKNETSGENVVTMPHQQAHSA